MNKLFKIIGTITVVSLLSIASEAFLPLHKSEILMYSGVIFLILAAIYPALEIAINSYASGYIPEKSVERVATRYKRYYSIYRENTCEKRIGLVEHILLNSTYIGICLMLVGVVFLP